ncbi:hypothetical protein BHM03_00016349 [Ensete ventricosum]|nr:hypothetical protein BHM03_00016349 [Ensete ventricosum]
MRLNRVKSCYAFLLRFRSKGSKEEGRQPPCRVGHPRPGRGQGPLQGGGWLRLGPARKGGQRRPQGAAIAREHSLLQGARKGLPPTGATTPAAGVAAPWQGGCQRARATAACAGHGGGDIMRVREEG